MAYVKGKVWKPGDIISYEDLNDLQKKADAAGEPKASKANIPATPEKSDKDESRK